MLNVGSVVKAWKIANQSQSSNRAPADIFHQAIVDLCSGRDHHCAACELAVVEGDKKAWATIEVLLPFDTERKRPSVESCQGQKDGGDVSQFAPSAEAPRTERGDVRGKAHA